MRFSTGRVLETAHTKRWTQEQIDEANNVENTMVFVGFKNSDRGKSRRLVVRCPDKLTADIIAECLNTIEFAYEHPTPKGLWSIREACKKLQGFK